MKKWSVNRDHIIEAWYDQVSQLGIPTKYRIVLITGYNAEGREIKRIITKSSEHECVEFINSLNLLTP